MSLLIVMIIGLSVQGQTTISTTGFLNNNGSSVVTFNFVNNNAFPVQITDLASIAGANGTNTAELWYRTTAIAGPPGAISVPNGWTMHISAPVTTIANTTTTVTQPMLTGINLTIPAGSTYGLCFSLTGGNLRYSTIPAGTYTFSGGGCDITTGTNQGYGGTLASPTNSPRGFLGSVTFAPVAPCAGTPTPGNTLSSANPVCPNANFTLSLQNLQGTGTTFQWQSSPDGITWTNIVGATNALYTTSITTATYYQCIVTCTNSGLSATSTPILVNVGFSASCYCQTIPAFTGDEEIFNVTLGTLNNNSTCATVAPGPGSLAMRYANYTSGPGAPAAPNLTQGIPYSFNVNVNTCGVTNFNSGLAIFIDYNIDGDFTDPGEKVYTNGALANITCVPATNVTGSITVPVASTPGTTVMRVMNAESISGDAITPCMAYNYGETEDYLVTIVAAPPTDIAITGFARPLTTGCYTSADSVVVTISNQGSSVHDFSLNPTTINASVTGPNAMVFPPVVVNTGTLPIAASLNVVITTTYNMSAAGTYGFSATATTVGDPNPGNDNVGPTNFTFSAGTALAASGGQTCAGSPGNVSLVGLTPSNASIQWQESPNNITWTNIIGQTGPTMNAPVLDTTFYRAVICGGITSVSDTVFTISVTAATTTHDTICGLGTASLTAAGSGPLHWFTAPTGGTEVNTGTTYMPAVTVSDTFWVENRFVDCGAAGAPVTPTCYPAYTSSCTSADFINNFSTTGGTTNITNNGTGCNGTLPTNTTFFPAMNVSVSAGASFNISAQSGASWGQGFRLWIDYNNDGDFADAGEDVWNSGVSGTGVFTGVVTVPSNTSSGPKRMRLMCRFGTVPVTTDHCSTGLSFGEVEEYTLNVCTMCAATRVPSIVTVTAPPSITAATAAPLYCDGDTITMTVTSSNANYGYTWSPSTYLNTTTGSSVQSVPPTGSYTYYVDALDAATGCANLDSVSFDVNQSPSVVASANPNMVCANTASTLNTTVNTVPFAVDVMDSQNTTTTYPAPYGNWYWGAKNEYLILASELTAAGISAGPIDGLSWEVLALTATPLQGFSIRMGHSTLTSLTTFSTGTTVVLAPIVYTPVMGVNVHTFNTPFMWNGVDNIVVQTCFNNGSFTTNCVMAQTTMPYTACVYYFQDAAGVCPQTTPNGTSSMRPTTTLYAQSNALTYLWNPAGTLSSATASDPTAMPTTTTTYSVVVTDPATGCTATDTTVVTTLPTPDPNFGADTVICSNDSLTLDGSFGPSYTYLWQDASTAQTLTVTAFGNYSVEVTDNVSGCVGRDTILVGINAAPSFTLGSDVTVCQGTQVSFSGPGGQFDYAWSTLDSTISITTGTAGSYDLAVTDTVNGCTSMDTVNLSVNPVPVVALGSDTSVCSADGSVTLSGPAGNFEYLWNTSDTTMSITVNSSGNYFVVVTDTATSCTAGDTMFLTYNSSPVANLGNDTTFCSANGPITLVGPAGTHSYVWNDMSTGMTLQAGTTGLYYVDVLDTITGCTTTDSIMVNVPTTPSFTLADTSFCGTQFTINGPAGSYDYDWSTLDSTQSITVTASGTYTLTVTDTTSGCNSSDVSTVNINANPTVALTASDNVVCEDDANVILTGSPNGGTYTGTSVTGNQFDPSVGVGTYMMTYNFTDVNGCPGSDTTSIEVTACVGITEPFAGAGMNIFPNPNTGRFTFFAADMNCAEMTIEITTVEGQTVYSNQYSNVQGNFTQEINMAEFANGVYFMRVTTDGAVYTQRVVKQE